MINRLKFEPSDFDGYGLADNYKRDLANMTNAKLEEWKREATVVYGSQDAEGSWFLSTNRATDKIPDTHRALLIEVEELSKEPCKHEPDWFDVIDVTRDGKAPMLECRHCGKPLKATYI